MIRGLLLLLFAAPAFGGEPEPVELATPTGKLVGVIDLPTSPGPWPVVLLHPGSGPTNHDGNSRGVVNNHLKFLGEALASQGIACLRIDKRGIAGSASAGRSEAELRFEHLVDDAVAWLRLLKADRRFSRVSIIGHSEGALVASLAVQKEPVSALISLCGPGRRPGDVLREQLATKLTGELAESSTKILAELEAGRTVKDVPKSLMALYRPSVQPYLISLLVYDPADELRKCRYPVLIVSGTTDVQIPIADAERLGKDHPTAKMKLVKHLSHVLKEATSDQLFAQQLTVYVDPKRPVMPELVNVLMEFIEPKKVSSSLDREE